MTQGFTDDSKKERGGWRSLKTSYSKLGICQEEAGRMVWNEQFKSKEDTCLAPVAVRKKMRKIAVITLISCRGSSVYSGDLDGEGKVQQRN